MKYYSIVFSPTGGTEKAAEAIIQSWPGVEKIDLSVFGQDYSKIELESGGLALVAMPSFGGLAPALALERLEQIRGSGVRCVVAAVYGDRAYEDTLVQMEDSAEKAGMKVIAGISAVAEHSIARNIAAGRPDATDIEGLSDFGRKILEKAGSDDMSKPELPGSRPYKKGMSSEMRPKAGASCTGCGICAQKCPAGAIPADAPRVTDEDKCISCMRCISVCPVGARSLNSVKLAVVSGVLKKLCAGEKHPELFI